MAFWNNILPTRRRKSERLEERLEVLERNLSPENPSTPLSAYMSQDIRISESGTAIDQSSMLSITAVWRCINVISSTVARLPIEIFRVQNGSLEKDRNHSLHNLLTYNISSWYTPFTFFESVVAQMCIHGNAFAHIVTNGGGEAVELEVINEPMSLHLFTYSEKNDPANGVYLIYKTVNSKRTYLQSEILHFRGFGNHPLYGLSPLEAHRDTFGVSRSAKDYESAIFKNGGFLTGIVESDLKLSNEQRQNIGSAFKKSYQGAKNAGGIAIFDYGFKFKPMNMKPSDIEYIQNQRFNVHEIARIYGIPPHKLFDLEKATMNNMEIQNSGFVETINIYCERIEQELRRKLTSDKNTLIRFNLYELSRGDMQARTEYYRNRMNTGSITPNEIRMYEGENPSEQAGMNDYYLQVNMQKVKDFDKIENIKSNE